MTFYIAQGQWDRQWMTRQMLLLWAAAICSGDLHAQRTDESKYPSCLCMRQIMVHDSPYEQRTISASTECRYNQELKTHTS